MREGVTDAGRTTTEQTLKIELLSQWKLEAEFRKNLKKKISTKTKQNTVVGAEFKVIKWAGSIVAHGYVKSPLIIHDQ